MSTVKCGTATIKPGKAVVAGSYTTITFEYTAEHPVDDTGFVKIVFRYAGDFGTPQFDDPRGDNFCSVSTTGDCRIDPYWSPKGHTRPWGKSLYLKVMAGFLDAGDKVTVVFGDTSGGSAGWQAQTFVEESFEFKTFADPFATYQFKELRQSPTLKIIPGAPKRAVCHAPAQAKINEAFKYFLVLEDRWGNPAGLPRAFEHGGFSQGGIKRVSAQDPESGLSAVSNPVKVYQDSPEYSHFWADFHGQSEETVGSNSIDDYYRFAREYAHLDIAAHQGNDFQISDSFWEKINQAADEFNRAGKFVTFPGFEWSGNTPLGGDRNVYYKSSGDEIFRSSADLLPDATKYPLAPTADKLFEKLKGKDSFVFAHVGGRYANMAMHDAASETAVEIHSAWGTFQWLLADALKAGYRVGICANSDGHKGRPGASYPGASRFGSYGGLTCVLAEKLDREHVYKAMKQRHYYATTGNRSVIGLECAAAGKSAMMGDVIRLKDGEEPVLNISFAGSAPVEKITVYNKLDIVKSIRMNQATGSSRRIKIIWSGAEVRGRDRASNWDGCLQLSGNSIKNIQAINFWNPAKPIQQLSDRELKWQSITTGGLAGMIIELADHNTGSIDIKTTQGNLRCAISDIGTEEKIIDCSGLEKQLAVYRLSDSDSARDVQQSITLCGLKPGDNPIYVRVDQQDGHIAWTSPVYIVL